MLLLLSLHAIPAVRSTDGGAAGGAATAAAALLSLQAIPAVLNRA